MDELRPGLWTWTAPHPAPVEILLPTHGDAVAAEPAAALARAPER